MTMTATVNSAVSYTHLNQCTNFFIVRDIKMIVKWIIVFFILTYVASFLF